jgi:hypothetical protein
MSLENDAFVHRRNQVGLIQDLTLAGNRLDHSHTSNIFNLWTDGCGKPCLYAK